MLNSLTNVANLRSIKLLGALGAAIVFASASNAQSTDAGRTVSNTFTLDYSVNDTPQSQITNSGSPTNFTVDRLIDLTVLQTNSPQSVVPGAPNTLAQLTFTVTNSGNDNQAYSFSLADQAGDTFDVPAAELTISYSVDGGVTFTDVAPVAVGTATTTSVTPDIPGGDAVLVRVSANVPDTAVNAQFDDIVLIAETRNPIAWAFETPAPAAGALTTGVNFEGAAGTNDLLNVAQNVFADDDGDTAALDSALNGRDLDTGRFVIEAPNLQGAKTVDIVSTDGTNCANFATAPSNTQFSVAGACVEYVITVSNLGANDSDGNAVPPDNIPATNIVVADTLPAELTFVAATVEGFTGTAPTASPALPASGTDCGASACLVRFENGTVSAPNNTAGAPSVARVRIRALIK